MHVRQPLFPQWGITVPNRYFALIASHATACGDLCSTQTKHMRDSRTLSCVVAAASWRAFSAASSAAAAASACARATSASRCRATAAIVARSSAASCRRLLRSRMLFCSSCAADKTKIKKGSTTDCLRVNLGPKCRHARMNSLSVSARPYLRLPGTALNVTAGKTHLPHNTNRERRSYTQTAVAHEFRVKVHMRERTHDLSEL